MKKILSFFFGLLLSLPFLAQKTTKSFHDFKVTAIDGKEFDLATLKGKKVLVVNTASECGYTYQYEGLEKLYEKYKDKNFVIVGFPANDFGKQEPGTNDEIQSFCKKNYGVTFPMMSKITVVGDDMASVYKWLTTKEQNGKEDSPVKWNFNKFLIDENGKWVASYKSKTSPNDDEIIKWIEGK